LALHQNRLQHRIARCSGRNRPRNVVRKKRRRIRDRTVETQGISQMLDWKVGKFLMVWLEKRMREKKRYVSSFVPRTKQGQTRDMMHPHVTFRDIRQQLLHAFCLSPLLKTGAFLSSSETGRRPIDHVRLRSRHKQGVNIFFQCFTWDLISRLYL
jgi:hypothetical protein